MPCVLVRLPKVARTAADGRGHRDRVVCVLSENVRKQLGHPSLYGVRVALDEGANTKDSSVTLAQRAGVVWGLPCWECAVLRKADEPVLCEDARSVVSATNLGSTQKMYLQIDNTPSWRHTQDPGKRSISSVSDGDEVRSVGHT